MMGGGPSVKTTTKPFVSSIWGRLHESKENYVGSGTWISFLHSFVSSNMLSLRPLASISCCITSIHVFFGLPCALLTCPNLIRSTCRSGASVSLRRIWPNHRRRFSLIFSFTEATHFRPSVRLSHLLRRKLGLQYFGLGHYELQLKCILTVKWMGFNSKYWGERRWVHSTVFWVGSWWNFNLPLGTNEWSCHSVGL